MESLGAPIWEVALNILGANGLDSWFAYGHSGREAQSLTPSSDVGTYPVERVCNNRGSRVVPDILLAETLLWMMLHFLA